MRVARKVFAVAVVCGLWTVDSQAQTYPSTTDPRSGLKAGKDEFGVAKKGMDLVSLTKKPAEFDTARGLTFANSDLAFAGDYVFQGNFSGFTIWDVSNPAKPVVASVIRCATSQGDPSIYGGLLFVSAEGGANRSDCGMGGVQNLHDGMHGVRIFDVRNPRAPKLVKNVQTCKGSHTHTLAPDRKNKNILYIYVSGSGGARPDSVLKGCKASDDAADEANSLFRLDIIKVDLREPEKAEVVGGARIFTGLDAAPQSSARQAAAAGRGGRGGRGGADPVAPAPRPTGPRNCHDVTAYPEKNILAGACGSYGLLVDISNREKPKRLAAQADTNFSLWHTAMFSNDGAKVVFSDEWGGGTSPMCQANSMMQMGGNTVLSIDPKSKQYKQHAYYKINTAQTAQENCVSHNGGLIPVPGRDVLVQGWYQGGISVMDFSDPDKPMELAYYDRGSIDPLPGADVPMAGGAAGGRGGGPRGTIGGSWGAYYYNGRVYSSEIDRGFDIYDLQPTENLSANEIAAAKLVTFDEYNPQSQPVIKWPAAFVVVRAFLDQLVRNGGVTSDRSQAYNTALDAAEKETGSKRKNMLNAMAKQVTRDIKDAKDPKRVELMVDAIKNLANATK